DKSGAVVPGVTVTLSSPALLQPQVAVTSSTGSYSFPRIPIGVYSVKFELSGFTTVLRSGVSIVIGQNANINGSLDVSSKQEVIEVTGEAPLIDLRSNARTNNFNQDALQNIPSARDPWVILQQSAGIVMDRENIGGNMSGQQSNFIARGAATTQQKWNLDGIDITDMSATGASPVYYDFDAFDEMQITTGGADVTMQTAGVGVNLITKSGSDKFKGSARYYITDKKFQATNVTDSLRALGATSGNPIQNIKDYGFEMGGPIVKGKAWIWGSYGTQDIKVGVNGFFLKEAEHAGCGVTRTAAGAVKSAADLAQVPFATIKDCLNTDLTTLETFNLKFNYRLSSKDTFSLFANKAGKIRNARGVSDTCTIDCSNRQKGVEDPALGSKYWKTGVPKTYKASMRHIFSDRFLMEFQYAHIGNNFVLDHHEDALKTVQPLINIQTGFQDRSSTSQQFVRPTNSFDLNGTRSSSGFLGGDHAVKFGLRYRQDRAISTAHRGGNIDTRFNEVAGALVPAQATIYRDSITDYNLFDHSAYLQDTFTKDKFTIIAGVRFDRQWDRANTGAVPQTPIFGQITQTGLPFNQLPSVTFAGAESGVKFNDFAPRLGLTYDLKGDGHNVVKVNYARYASQLGDGSLSSTYNPVAQATVRYPWTDLNGDKFVQPNEINISAAPLAQSSGYNYLTPSALTTSGRVDTNLKNEKTDELILGFDKQFSNSFAMGIAGIYRKYDNFRWSDTDNITDADYSPISFTPAATACPAAQNAQCPTVTYYQPTSKNLSNFATFAVTNRPGATRTYKGIELTGRKRVKSFNMNGSFTLSDTKSFFKQGSFEDPTNLANIDGAQYAPETSGSGLGNVFPNAKWILRATASYTIPWQKIGIAANYNGRSGYPSPFGILSPTRANGAGTATVYLAPLGDVRLPAFHNLDARIDKTVRVKAAKIVLSLDVFNVLNSDIVQSINLRQNATNANTISSLVAPRVLRFGARLNW
ncbi:MAG: TonB-dependent receptor, partial [Vicinamibacteria bacterium]